MSCHLTRSSTDFGFQRTSAQLIPGDKRNTIRDTRAWGEMKGLCDDESSIFLIPQVVLARERLCA